MFSKLKKGRYYFTPYFVGWGGLALYFLVYIDLFFNF